jgi:hypothetical protein
MLDSGCPGASTAWCLGLSHVDVTRAVQPGRFERQKWLVQAVVVLPAAVLLVGEGNWV